MIGCSRSRVYQMIRAGELPSVVLPGGRLVRVPAAALAAKFEVPLRLRNRERKQSDRQRECLRVNNAKSARAANLGRFSHNQHP